jgi:hypothetical protein
VPGLFPPSIIRKLRPTSNDYILVSTQTHSRSTQNPIQSTQTPTQSTQAHTQSTQTHTLDPPKPSLNPPKPPANPPKPAGAARATGQLLVVVFGGGGGGGGAVCDCLLIVYLVRRRQSHICMGRVSKRYCTCVLKVCREYRVHCEQTVTPAARRAYPQYAEWRCYATISTVILSSMSVVTRSFAHHFRCFMHHFRLINVCVLLRHIRFGSIQSPL